MKAVPFRLKAILLFLFTVFGFYSTFSASPRLLLRTSLRSVHQKKKPIYHYPWTSFKQDYFVDCYLSCQKNPTKNNSLYVRLYEVFSASTMLKGMTINQDNACMQYAHNYSYVNNFSANSIVKNLNLNIQSTMKEEGASSASWLQKSVQLASSIASLKHLFPSMPTESVIVSADLLRSISIDSNNLTSLTSSLTELQQSKMNSDTFFLRNVGPKWASRTNPLLQKMIHDNLCLPKADQDCPTRIIEFGCGIAGNLRHYCGTHECERAVCIEASTYSHFINTMTLPSSFEMLIGDITNQNVYNNLPSKSYDLVYQSWAFMYVPGIHFHVHTLLPNLYNTLSLFGYYAFEGPIGLLNSKGMMAPTPTGQKIRNDADGTEKKKKNIESSEFWIDHCRLLVNSGHFRLIEDTRYTGNKWSVVNDLATFNKPFVRMTKYTKHKGTEWDKTQKDGCSHFPKASNDGTENWRKAMEQCRGGRNCRWNYEYEGRCLPSVAINWEDAVTSDCLVQKMTDVDIEVFRESLSAMVL